MNSLRREFLWYVMMMMMILCHNFERINTTRRNLCVWVCVFVCDWHLVVCSNGTLVWRFVVNFLFVRSHLPRPCLAALSYFVCVPAGMVVNILVGCVVFDPSGFTGSIDSLIGIDRIDT